MKAEFLPVYNKIIEKYKDKWFTTYDISEAKPVEETKDVFTWNLDTTELSYFNKILNLLTSVKILQRKREYGQANPKLKKGVYMFYKLEKEVDERIIKAMDTLYKEGYYSISDISSVKLLYVDDDTLADINQRINSLEESNKALSQEVSRLSGKVDF